VEDRARRQPDAGRERVEDARTKSGRCVETERGAHLRTDKGLVRKIAISDEMTDGIVETIERSPRLAVACAPGTWNACSGAGPLRTAANRVGPKPCGISRAAVLESSRPLNGRRALRLQRVISGLKRRERVAACIDEC